MPQAFSLCPRTSRVGKEDKEWLYLHQSSSQRPPRRMLIEHASAWCLTKGFSSNDLGDGKGKKHKKKNGAGKKPHSKIGIHPSASHMHQRSMRLYLERTNAPPTTNELPVQDDLEMNDNTDAALICEERVGSSVSEVDSAESDRTDTTIEDTSSRKRTRQPSMAAFLRTRTTPTDTRTTRDSTNDANALLEWARTQRTRTAENNHHTIFYGTTVAIGLHDEDLHQAITCAQSLSSIQRDDPQAILDAFGDIRMCSALHLEDVHYRNTPLTGYCSAIALAELHYGSAIGSIDIPDQRQRLIDSLTVLQCASRQQNMKEADRALQVYLDQLQAHPNESTLDSKYWMAADLFLALSRLTETPADLWEEDQAISPFESGWMQPTVAVPSAPHIHRVSEIPSSQLLRMYDDGKTHVGHASGHHFFIRFEANEVNLDFKATLLNMVYQLCNSPAVNRPTPLPPATTAKYQAMDGDLLLYISPSNQPLIQE